MEMAQFIFMKNLELLGLELFISQVILMQQSQQKELDNGFMKLNMKFLLIGLLTLLAQTIKLVDLEKLERESLLLPLRELDTWFLNGDQILDSTSSKSLSRENHSSQSKHLHQSFHLSNLDKLS